MSSIDPFEFDYFGSDVVYGRGCVDRLESFLGERGFERALVVCGTNVGANEELMGPIERGLGDALADTFDETTPEKSAETVYDGIEVMQSMDADVLVAVGGGSSLDIARQMGAFEADGRPLSAYREAAREGTLEPPEAGDSPMPVVVVPTTLAGADISTGGSVTILTAEDSPTGSTIRTSGSNMPVGMFYDPALFETTPKGVLAGSTMNGFDKPIETLYSLGGTPVSHATAVHSLRLFGDAIPEFASGDADALEAAIVAIILAQFQRKTSVIHSFGHGFSRHYDVHQGEVHAVVAPRVLRYLFDHVDANRRLIATGLGVETASLSDGEVGAAVVEAVADVRDSLELPGRIRELGDIPESDLPKIAAYIRDDPNMDRAPPGLDATEAEIEAVLREAW